MKYINESDVREMMECGDISQAHAVELISKYLKKIVDEAEINIRNVEFKPENFIDEINCNTSVADIYFLMGMEDCVLDKVISIAEVLIDGCRTRQKEIAPIINSLSTIVDGE